MGPTDSPPPRRSGETGSSSLSSSGAVAADIEGASAVKRGMRADASVLGVPVPSDVPKVSGLVRDFVAEHPEIALLRDHFVLCLCVFVCVVA